MVRRFKFKIPFLEDEEPIKEIKPEDSLNLLEE